MKKMGTDMNESKCTNQDFEFIKGVAAACSCVAKTLDEPTSAQSILDCLGITKKDLVDAGCESYDLDWIGNE